GDLMLGSTFPPGSPLPPRDGADLLAEVTPILRGADLAFGNLEGPLFDGRDAPTCTPGAVAEKQHGKPGGDGSCWAFRMPARYGRGLRRDGGEGRRPGRERGAVSPVPVLRGRRARPPLLARRVGQRYADPHDDGRPPRPRDPTAPRPGSAATGGAGRS